MMNPIFAMFSWVIDSVSQISYSAHRSEMKENESHIAGIIFARSGYVFM